MSKIISLEKILNDVASKDIIFAAVDPIHRKQLIEGRIHFFPDDFTVKQFRFGRKNVIYLNEVANKNCKYCYGTGKTGVRINNITEPTNTLAKNFIIYIQKERSSPKIADIFIKNKIIPPQFREEFEILVQMALKELDDSERDVINLYGLGEKYAKMMKEDFVFKEVLWCECFVKNLQKEVERVRREIMFSIN